MNRWPSKEDKCWDCGSSIPNHHTKECAFSDPEDFLDLPQIPGTQWWTGEFPGKEENLREN